MRTGIILEFADGEYEFKLTLANILELQEKTKTGIGALFTRVVTGTFPDDNDDTKRTAFPLAATFYIDDLHNIIRLGLIGGGMEPVAAKKLTERYTYPEQPMKPTWALASAILMAAMEGYEVKEPAPAGSKKKRKPTTTRTDGSTPE